MLRDPMSWVNDRRQVLDRDQEKLTHALAMLLGKRRQTFGALAAALDAMSPLKVLARGYAIAQRETGVVKSVEGFRPGDPLRVSLSDGELDCEVKSITQNRGGMSLGSEEKADL